MQCANAIPHSDILARRPGREDAPKSWRVSLAKIIENDYSLAAGRYKPVTLEAVNHDQPADILRDVLDLEDQIAAKARKLLAKTHGDTV